MSVILRVLLIVVSVCAAVFVFKKIKKAQLNIDDSIYWILISVLILVLSIFPQIAIAASDLLEVQSPANFIFLVIIFLLGVKLFGLAVDLSIQKHRLNALIQKLAIRFQEEDKDK